MMSSYNIHVGDCVTLLPTLPVALVQAIVTSPPYWGLRDYGIAPTEWPEISYAPMAGLPELVIPAMVCCLGLEPTPEAFIGHLLHVFRLAAPALRQDGTCWVNLGDSYIGSASYNAPRKSGNSFDKQTAPRQPNPKSDSLSPKNMVGIPWRFALAMQGDGWYLRQDIIWHKPNPMPESVTDRCTKAHEYIFLFAKSPKYYFDAESIQEPSAMRAPGNLNPLTSLPSERQGENYNIRGSLHKIEPSENRNKRDVWTVATKPYSEAHFATFPPKLIEPCILSGSRPGDVVLDMFSGSGTTGEVATAHGRAYVGMEASAKNVKLHKKRMSGLQYQLIPAA